ncbi:hypothetical protein V5O48_009713 [Marasmius crinis-equi]|uniref:F-box domain-containing protein n=1 Tax=Marasmius crinis-equi TaxID=585013 RepID=A0ABR3FAH4_9AGAR
MSAEVLWMIAKALDDPADLHHLLHVNRRLFRIAAPLRYASIHFDTYLTLCRAAPMYTIAQDADRSAIYHSAPRRVDIGGPADGRQWGFERTFKVLRTLTAVRSLHIWNLPSFSYDRLAHWVSNMETLETLEVVSPATRDFMPRYHTPALPATFPSLTRVHFLNFQWSTIESTLDQSLSSLALLSLLSTIRSFCADVKSWISMSRGRWCERLSFPPNVTELEILVGSECNMRDMQDEAWARGLFRALRVCGDKLESLRVQLPYQTRTVLDSRISLSRLAVFVGPEGLIRSMDLHGPLTVLWITSCAVDAEPDVAPWVSVWPTLHNPSTLRMLRVASWDIRTLDLTDVYSNLPELEELSIFTKIRLTKEELVSFGDAFRRCPRLWNVTILGPSGAMQPQKEVAGIASAWHKVAPNLGSIRLSTSEKWHLQYDWDDQKFVWDSKSVTFSRGYKQVDLPKRLKPCSLLVPPYSPNLRARYPDSDTEYETGSESE